jgi:hypothetical protein
VTVLIRSMEGILGVIRAKREALNISFETLDSIAGTQPGYCSKILAPVPMRGIGYQSLGDLLGALAIGFVPVDDLEQQTRVQSRWQKKKRPQKLVASSDLSKQEEIPEKSKQLECFTVMQIRGRAGGIASGKTRRRKALRRRELQRLRSHAARLSWAKRAESRA